MEKARNADVLIVLLRWIGGRGQRWTLYPAPGPEGLIRPTLLKGVVVPQTVLIGSELLPYKTPISLEGPCARSSQTIRSHIRAENSGAECLDNSLPRNWIEGRGCVAHRDSRQRARPLNVLRAGRADAQLSYDRRRRTSDMHGFLKRGYEISGVREPPAPDYVGIAHTCNDTTFARYRRCIPPSMAERFNNGFSISKPVITCISETANQPVESTSPLTQRAS
jgi:hypothetical protein